MIEEIQRISIGGSRRYKGLLGFQKEEKSVTDIIEEIHHSRIILWGGEPTLRRDILQLMKQVKQKVSWLCVRTDGVVFQKPKLAKQLKNAGLDAIIVPIPSLQSDLNTWVLGKGFTKKALQAMKLGKVIGLEVIAEVLVTRSGMGRIAQTFLGLIRQGISKIIIRAIEADEVNIDRQISILPRLGLLEQELRRVLLIAEQEDVEVIFEGFSACGFQEDIFNQWLFIDRQYLLCRNNEHQHCFVPKSYVQQFGWLEFSREEIDVVEVPFQTIEIRSEDSSRSVRQHLVQISQTKPQELHILGNFQHEQLYSILRDSLRLGIPEIWLIGDLQALLSISKMEWFRLKALKGLGHIIMEPKLSEDIVDLFERTKRFEQRIYAHVGSMNEIILYDRMFREKKIPIAPHFFLDGEWNIQALLEIIKTLSPEIQRNFDELVPFCLGAGAPQKKRFNTWKGVRDREKESSWNSFSQMISCPKKKDCLAFQNCCGIMKEWEQELHIIKEET